MTTTDRIIPAITHLQDVAARLSRAALIAGDRRNLNALNKAAYHLDRGCEIRIIGGDVLIPSATAAGTVYRVSGAGCSCEAALHGHACWHASIAEILLVAWDEQGAEDDGDEGAGGDETDPPANWPRDTNGMPLDWYAAKRAVELGTAQLGRRLAQARAAYAY